MYTSQGVQAYRHTDINSMTREKMIVLLYEKIVSDLHEVLAAIEQGDRIAMTRRANHSQRIISELRGALDHGIGGDISRNLEALYDFMFHQHLELLVDQDPAHAHNCLRVLHPLLDAWRQVPIGTGEKAAREHARGELPPAIGADRAGERAPEPTTAGAAGGPGGPTPTPTEEAEPVGAGTASELVSYSA